MKKAASLLLLPLICSAQVLTTSRVSSLANRYHGRVSGQPLRTPAPTAAAAPYIWLKGSTLTVGGSPSTWTDSSGNSHTCTFGTPKPTVITGSYGYPAALFISNTGSQPATGTPCTFSSISLNNRAITILAVYRHQGTDIGATDLNAAQNILGMTGSQDMGLMLAMDDHAFFTTDQTSRMWLYVESSGTIATPAVANSYIWGGPSLVGMRSNGTNIVGYGDDARSWTILGSAPTSVTYTAATVGCAAGGNGYCASGELYELLIFNSALSDANVTLWEAYLKDEYGLSRPRNVQILFDTNSQFVGYLGLKHNMATYVADDFQNRYQFRSDAMYSYTTAQLVSAFAKVITPYYDPSMTNIVVVYEVLNSLIGGQTAAQVLTSMQSYYTAAHAAGFKVIACTPNAITVTGSYTDTKRTTLISSMKTNTATISDVNVTACDIGEDTILGTAANTTNTTYFQDGEHFTELGARMAATYVTAAIKQLLNQ